MITRFGVKNFKALRDVELELTPLHVLIGPNDSGKTSILQALAAVCRSVDFKLSLAFVGRWNGRELVWQENRQELVSFSLLATEGDKKVSYETSFDFSLESRIVATASES
jgi:AAA15 family ATPase/GTPase